MALGTDQRLGQVQRKRLSSNARDGLSRKRVQKEFRRFASTCLHGRPCNFRTARCGLCTAPPKKCLDFPGTWLFVSKPKGPLTALLDLGTWQRSCGARADVLQRSRLKGAAQCHPLRCHGQPGHRPGIYHRSLTCCVSRNEPMVDFCVVCLLFLLFVCLPFVVCLFVSCLFVIPIIILPCFLIFPEETKNGWMAFVSRPFHISWASS